MKFSDDEVRRRLFKFLENLDQPPGFPKGSWMKQRKVVRQDYTGSSSNDDVMCITEVTDKNANKNSKKNVMDADRTINSVDMTGPLSPPDSGYSTSVSTNGTTESLMSSSSRRGEGSKAQSHIHISMEAKGERTTVLAGEVGSIVTTTADVHSEISQNTYLVDSEDDVFYDAEGSSVEGNISSNIRQRQDLANGDIPSETVQDGQCLSVQSPAECNIAGAVTKNLVAPSTPPPSPTLSDQNDSIQRNTSRGSENSPFSLHAPEVSAKLKSLQLTEGAMGNDNSQDDSNDSSEADLSLESISSERSKTLDVPSAKRLAKRLYMQDGFKKSDIAMHLSKKNDFSRLVADEYFSHYTFTGERLDQSLRKFLSNVAVTGETQERERVLYHFAKRYHECNGGLYQSEGAVNTLTCALMLLNTDLHGKKNIGKKMTLNAFITNMEGLNDGGDFPKDTLKAFYQAIKSNPLEWAQDQNDGQTETLPGAKSKARNGSLKVSGAPLLKMETDSNAPIYMKGYIMRKCIREADGKKPSRNKRKWKLFFGTVKGLILYLHKTEATADSHFEIPKEAISLHHSLAGKTPNYKKRPNVFTLRLANWKEYLLQCTEPTSMQNWMQSLNMAASVHSSPPLPAAVGRQKRFTRPLLPSATSKLPLQNQLKNHESKCKELEQELATHRENSPDSSAKSTVTKDYKLKTEYLEYEVMRFKTYTYLLQAGPPSAPRDQTELHSEGNSNGKATSPTSVASGDSEQPVFRAHKDRDSISSDEDSDDSGADFLMDLPVNDMDYSTQL
ncbi:PH and SEC7 domain-containing protein 3 [Holothuria leucospilota]|uniref:PH and SEC7 domain-containing protein 3 n=1 Tax=Holothuria leucospilota TaxID=206669 RepID=A0A9Q1BFH7_HOLLE|nr:PH and SEC7 domain-containing protein 3 [Holothuria leucospilota]